MINKIVSILDSTTEAVFVSDALTGEIIYINDTGAEYVGRNKGACLGERCYQIFWERSHNCERCESIDKCQGHFYEEDTILKSNKRKIHMKARIEEIGRAHV